MRYFKLYFLSIFILILSSCQDSQTIVDTNVELKNRNWSYVEKIKIPVKIVSPELNYNVYFNLRHTANYKYSNIFILVHTIGADGKKRTERKEFKLALPDGEWLGSGSGNRYSYQLLLKSGYKFPQKGNYIFELEQNMRDNPLKDITDVGLRVEKAP